MQPLVQSAIDAANRGENNKALEFCKQALAANPNDVDAWLVVAAVVEQPERKRQCLNRVLSLDPTNQIARDELLEMDRAAMGGTPPFVPEPAPVSRPTYQSAPPSSNYPTSTSAFEAEPVSKPAYQSSLSSDYPTSIPAFESAPAPEQSAPIAPQVQAKVVPKSSSKTRAEKRLVFKYPLFWRIIMYLFLVVFACAALGVASQDVVSSLPVFLMALLMGVGAIAMSPKVEITEAGIRASGLFSSSEAKWNEIKSMKSSGMKQRLELVKSNGQIVKVSSQVSGYPRVVEILRQKRPDLFGLAASAGQGNIAAGYGQAPSGSYGSAVSAPAFSGVKKFEKSLFKQYGAYVLIIPLCLLAAWVAYAEPENRIGASIVAIGCIVVMILQLFQVSAIKVEPNRLTIETLFEQKALSAREIKDIKMQSVRGRYGRVTNFVVVVPAEGKKYSLIGFSVGEEVMYGFLTNWWNAYRNR
jgi:hypothetical protein